MLSYLGSTLTNGQAVPQVVSAAFPLPVTLSGGIGGLAVAGTVADGAPAAGQFPVVGGGVDQATGNVQTFSVDATGALNVNLGGGGSLTVVQAVPANLQTTATQGPGNTANPWAVGGPAASGAATAGNPVKLGAVQLSVLPTYANGQVGDLQMTTKGSLYVSVAGPTGTPAVITAGADNQGANNGLAATANIQVFNGATYDRMTKARTAFRLPSSAASNNAANIKTTAGTVFQISGLVTLAASVCWLKFFDTTGVPNPAVLAQLYLFPLTINQPLFSFVLPTFGLYFPTGIGVALVANPADLDNTAIAAGQILGLNVAFL